MLKCFSCVVCRLTLPDDANIYGNVHGGTILKLIEDAGTIIATRYCNRAASQAEVYLRVLEFRILILIFRNMMQMFASILVSFIC